MKKHYDFSNAEQGKFYRPAEELEIPIYLEDKVKKYFTKQAAEKNIELNKIINLILKKEIELHNYFSS
jgi:hypothetical protein